MGSSLGAGLVALMLVGGLVSGLVPVVSAEALLIAAVLGADELWLPLVVAVAVGQSGAKVLIFLGAQNGRRLLGRRGGEAAARWLARVRPREAGPAQRAVRRRLPDAGRVAEVVRRPLPGSLLILGSAVAGIPPLAAMSAVAGMARMSLALFAPTCLAGRLVRFALVALPVAGVASGTR